MPIDADTWRRIGPLFDEALDLDEPQRAHFLQALGAKSPEDAAAVARLLAHEQSSSFPDSLPDLAGLLLAEPDSARASALIGSQVGPYLVQCVLGAGGMGTVYLGTRLDRPAKKVAVKVLRGEFAGENAVQRFDREREILSRLWHPNIAKMHDGGTTQDGSPFYAMEFVDGWTLSEYCEVRELDANERIGLLAKVAEALQYAHDHGVVHRDIKPSNILVTHDGSLKLVDFGIAKAVAVSSGETLTKGGLGPMTPEYAAPEQFANGRVGPATDVYQFGVLCFRILTGALPYDADPANTLEWANAVAEQAPRSLTTALGKARRAPISTSGWVALDRLIRSALAKEARRRPPSIRDLASRMLDASARAPSRMLRLDRLRTAIHAGDLVGRKIFGWARRRAREVAFGFVIASLAAALFVAGLQSYRSTAMVVQTFGITSGNVHAAGADTLRLIKLANAAEAAGQRPQAIALLERAGADEKSPVPQLWLAYIAYGRGDFPAGFALIAEAERRLGSIDDPYLWLFARMVRAELEQDWQGVLTNAQAMLEMQPEAWFLHFARAHKFLERGLRSAALVELKQIAPSRLDHRKLETAIADRAAMGDVDGARRQLATMEASPASRAFVAGRIEYSAGDFVAARRNFAVANEEGKREDRLDLVARAQLINGLLLGLEGTYDEARTRLRDAQVLLAERGETGYAADVSWVLAQIEHQTGRLAWRERELDEVRAKVVRHSSEPTVRPMLALFELRMLRTEAGDPGEMGGSPLMTRGVSALIAARRSFVAGRREEAQLSYSRALEQGVLETNFVDEARLLAAEMGLPVPPGELIDPPFPPLARFASQIALQQTRPSPASKILLGARK